MALIEQRTKKNMQALGTYKPEFDMTISIYCSLIEQYQSLEANFKKNEFNVEEKTGANGLKRSPIIGTLETLRKDILSYSNALGLTPSGLKKLNDEMNKNKKEVSKLEMALNSFGT